MHRLFRFPITASLLAASFICSPRAEAVCPNAATSVSIPLSDAAAVTVYDQSCNVISGTNVSVLSINPNSGPVNASTLPAVTMDSAGLHFSANGASTGTAGTVRLTFTPNGQTVNMNYVVGAPVTSISTGTTTP